METIILGSIIIGLIVTNIYLFSRMLEMNERYMKAIMAKNLTQYNESVIMDKVESKPQRPVENIPIEEADESVFKKFLKQVENNGQSFNSEV